METVRRYKNIHDTNILMMYKGELTFDLISSLIETLEGRVGELEEDKRIKKKFYSVITECIQNLYYHVDEAKFDDITISRYDAKSALIMISARKRFYSLMTGNYIPNKGIDKLTSKLNKINAVEGDELKAMYREALSNEEFSDKGTGGLGFIEIARKTGSKLIYNFYKVNDEYSYFTFQVRLPRVLEDIKRPKLAMN
ncbi:MAG: SiaB family protein kinase [Cyclobacteriaceae bacterium]